MKKIWQGLCLALAAAFYLLAVSARGEMGQNENVICVKLQNYFLDVQEAEQILHSEEKLEEPFRCLFWGSLGKRQMENPTLMRNTEVSCVGIYGDGNLYDERIHTLSKEDLDGCILDEKTAVELFGTVQAVGKEITMGGRAYTVRQVLRTREREALFSAGDEQQFTWVNLSRGEDASWTAAQEFLMRNNCQGEIVDGSFLKGSLGFVLALTLVLALWVQLFRRDFVRETHKKIRESVGMLYWGVLFLGIFGLFYIFVRYLADPQMIPSRWSDFSFWSELFDQQGEKFYRFLQSEKPFWAMEQLRSFGKGIGACVMTLLFAAVSEKRSHVR